MQKYLNLNLSAARRLAILKRDAEEFNGRPHASGAPRDWRAMRIAKFSGDADFGTGYNDNGYGRKIPVHVTFSKSQIPGRSWDYADKMVNERTGRKFLDHSGWFADDECGSTMRAIIVRLSHGRFMAGYYWNSNGEFVIIDEIHDDIRDAVSAGDYMAQRTAEDEKEADRRYREGAALSDDIESQEADLSAAKVKVAEFMKARHVSEYMREQVRDAVEQVREIRDELKKKHEKLREYDDVL